MNIDKEALRQKAEEIVGKHSLPGMGLGVVSSNEVLFSEGFGYAEIETKNPHTEKTIQRIGSITKTMTALVAMRLVEEGKLDMESNVADLMPTIKFNTQFSPIKVKHLFTHTSGIGEMPEVNDYSAADLKLWGSDGEFDIPNHYPNGIDVDLEQGTDWHYANHAWGILGAIVAKIEGDTCVESTLGACMLFKTEDIIEKDSENIKAYLRLGQVLREGGNAQQALKIHKSL